jgi:hypothetical protein
MQFIPLTTIASDIQATYLLHAIPKLAQIKLLESKNLPFEELTKDDAA